MGAKMRAVAIGLALLLATIGCITEKSPEPTDVAATGYTELPQVAQSTTPNVPATVSAELTRLAPTAMPTPSSLSEKHGRPVVAGMMG